MSILNFNFSDGIVRSFESGTDLRTVFNNYPIVNPDYPILAAKVDNKLYNLDFVPDRDCLIEPVTFKDKEGIDIYRRSICLILRRAAWDLYRNTRLVVGHSLSNGYYYDYDSDTPVSERTCNALEDKMVKIIQSNERIERYTVTIDEAKRIFEQTGQIDKLRLARHLNVETVGMYKFGEIYDLDHGPLAPDASCIKSFDLRVHYPGFVLLFPTSKSYIINRDMIPQKKLFKVYQESKAWAKILEVNNVGRLNDIIQSNNISEFIKISEVLHEKKIAEIADFIASKKDMLRVILIAGPSSSGKTTFSKRLSIHLRVNGIRPIALSLDDYFVNRDDCPRDSTGDYDFECLEALDVKLFNEHLKGLLEGKEVHIPKFDFETGNRSNNFKPMSIDEDQLIIIEGIHGLNPRLTSSVSEDLKFKIYISALTSLNIDDHNRIPTTDTRILRRIVRDYQFRNYDVKSTIQRWPSVRRGENKNIFPFQEMADIMFNSAQPYELSVLKEYAEPLLNSIKRSEKEYNEAKRLKNFLRQFLPLQPDEIPSSSILREFIGNSGFHY
jgi:uridine kinase